MLVPNLNNDAHDGTLAQADSYLQGWMNLIYASPDWKSGHLVVIVTADEDNNTPANIVLTTVIHPSQNGNVVSAALNHYSLNKFLTDLAGAPCMQNGCSASNFATAFGLKF
jgi:acid phosphatase